MWGGSDDKNWNCRTCPVCTTFLIFKNLWYPILIIFSSGPKWQWILDHTREFCIRICCYFCKYKNWELDNYMAVISTFKNRAKPVSFGGHNIIFLNNKLLKVLSIVSKPVKKILFLFKVHAAIEHCIMYLGESIIDM